MAKVKKLLRSPVCTAVLFILAAVLLLSGSIAGTRAALTYYSETYTSRVEMYDIGVCLVENGERVSWRDYGREADGRWQLQLAPGIQPEQLYVGGNRAQRAKSPNEFYHYMQAPVAFGTDPVTG